MYSWCHSLCIWVSLYICCMCEKKKGLLLLLHFLLFLCFLLTYYFVFLLFLLSSSSCLCCEGIVIFCHQQHSQPAPQDLPFSPSYTIYFCSQSCMCNLCLQFPSKLSTHCHSLAILGILDKKGPLTGLVWVSLPTRFIQHNLIQYRHSAVSAGWLWFHAACVWSSWYWDTTVVVSSPHSDMGSYIVKLFGNFQP